MKSMSKMNKKRIVVNGRTIDSMLSRKNPMVASNATQIMMECKAVLFIFQDDLALGTTFGGMWRWSASWRTVARVFALVVRCRVNQLSLNSRVGKNRDTKGSAPRERGRPTGFCPAALAAKPGR